MLTVMGGVVEFERSMMLERQREGITKAEGVHKGRKPTAPVKAAEVAALRAEDRSVRAIPASHAAILAERIAALMIDSSRRIAVELAAIDAGAAAMGLRL